MACLILFLQVWQPQKLWLSPALRSHDDSAATMEQKPPAKVGDQLVTTKFGRTCTTGFCAIGQPRLAVCIKPGTELAFEREIEAESLWFKRCAGSQLARFREDRVCVHHDALELPSGKVVLLTRLLVGQCATVLQLPVTELEKEVERLPVAQPATP